MNENSLHNPGKIRIILAHSIRLVRQSLKEYIRQEQDMEVVAETSDGEEAVALAAKLHPDLVLIDVVMYTLNGLEATKRIVRISPGTKVLVLTITENNEFIRDILQSGANGYLSIQSPCEDIIHAVRQISESEEIFTPAISLNPESVSSGGKSLSVTATRLTTRELSILKLVANGISNKEISQSLGLSLHYVKACLTIIFTKLGVSSRTEAVSAALTTDLLKLTDLNRVSSAEAPKSLPSLRGPG